MRITHAAIKIDNIIYQGKHHGECYAKSHVKNPKAENGFTTNIDTFVDNEQAAKIAFEAGQIDIHVKRVFSEHFWSSSCNGKYDYDPEKGYILREPASIIIKHKVKVIRAFVKAWIIVLFAVCLLGCILKYMLY